MKSFEKTYNLAMFLKHKMAQQTAQPGDLQKVLEDAKLFSWNDVSQSIFSLLDKLDFQGKFDCNILVDPNGTIKMQVIGSNPKNPQVQQGLQNMFAAKMGAALKTSGMKPSETVSVPWLKGVG